MTIPSRRRATPRRVTVEAVNDLGPRMRRITFAGAELASFTWPGPAAHVKLIVPDAGSDRVPFFDPYGPRPATMRTYTPRLFDAAAGELDIDFVLHGEGPASTWAARAAAGHEVILLGPGRAYDVDPSADWFVIAVDEAALPATETILEAIPPGVPVTALIEVSDAGEQRVLPGCTTADIRWIVRPTSARPGAALNEGLAAFTWPPGNGRVYVGCEAQAMREARALLLDRGIGEERIVTRGYWRSGAVNHPDHDFGDAPPA